MNISKQIIVPGIIPSIQNTSALGTLKTANHKSVKIETNGYVPMKGA